MSSLTSYHGSLVAFEGSNDAIPTQLRLLPTSPQVLILPSLQSYLGQDDSDEAFNAAKFILRVHRALVSRHEAATTFLDQADVANKRLVFVHGGAPSAQLTCLEAISRHETDGDYIAAQAIFDDLVKDGVGGLEDRCRGHNSNAFVLDDSDSDEDPTTKAMRAADALDRLTAGLQPSTELDMPLRLRPRSMSLPIYSFDDTFGDSTPFYVFGAADTEEELSFLNLSSPSLGPRLEVSYFDEGADGILTDLEEKQDFPPRSPSCVGEPYQADRSWPYGPLSPGSRSRSSSIPSVGLPASTEFLAGHKRSIRARHPRTRTCSLDRAVSGRRPRNVVRVAPMGSLDCNRDEGDEQGASYSRPFSDALAEDFAKLRTRLVLGDDLARETTVETTQSSMLIQPVPESRKCRAIPTSYVDRGTDAEQLPDPPAAEFSPLLPFLEDLVIHFKDEDHNPHLDLVISLFKNGSYPVTSPATSHQLDGLDDFPDTPTSHRSTAVIEPVETPGAVLDRQITFAIQKIEEYDPFAYDAPAWNSMTSSKQDFRTELQAPPTPAQTPPPEPRDQCEDRFYEFIITRSQTAVAVQNALRLVLGAQFPSEDQGYHYFRFPLLPELDGLWKPVFREAEPDSPSQDRQRVDQILAIGAQSTIKGDCVAAVTGQVERIGVKASGISRSGRLSFQYLLVNAMQAFTAQRLTNQSTDNPFENPYFLATLIIPQLETYLAANTEVRFLLLEYNSKHLATILALQKLVGVDMMKVAQIVSADANELLPFTHVRGTSIGGMVPIADMSQSPAMLSPLSASTSLKSPLSTSGFAVVPEHLSLKRANFLLTSSATDSEVATFLSTIRRILVDISPFYAPEELPKSKPARRKPSPLAGPFSPFPKMGMQSPPRTPMSPLTPRTPLSLTTAAPSPPPKEPQPPPSLPQKQQNQPPPRQRSVSPPSIQLPPPPPSPKAPSISETVRSSRSGRSIRSRPGTRSRRLGSRRGGADVESIFSLYLDDDSDADVEIEVKRLIPMFGRRPPARKGDSKKALKFLGLA